MVELFQSPISLGYFQSHSTSYWPTDEWINSTPEEQGMDSSQLNELKDYIEKYYSRTMDSLIIIRNGYIVFEEYPSGLNPDTLHALHSVTKSFTSALIGIAIEQGLIENVNQKVLEFFPNRSISNLTSEKQNMTIKHLLTMTSGFQWNEWQYTYQDSRNIVTRAINSGDFVQFMLDLPMDFTPGTVWSYCTGASHLLSAIIEIVSNKSTLTFAQEYLFDPLGITDVYWQFDAQHIYYGGSSLQLNPHDMAKFGLLFLKNGSWDDHQIIPADWIINSTSTIYHPFSEEYYGYGYQWWTWPSLGGAYYASGVNKQKIIIVPEHDLVVIFTADIRYEPDPEPAILYHFILSAINRAKKSIFLLDSRSIIPLAGILVVISPEIVFLVYWRKEHYNWQTYNSENPK